MVSLFEFTICIGSTSNVQALILRYLVLSYWGHVQDILGCYSTNVIKIPFILLLGCRVFLSVESWSLGWQVRKSCVSSSRSIGVVKAIWEQLLLSLLIRTDVRLFPLQGIQSSLSKELTGVWCLISRRLMCPARILIKRVIRMVVEQTPLMCLILRLVRYKMLSLD